MPRCTLSGLCLALVITGPVAFGQTATWNDPDALWWSDPEAWTPEEVPGAAHHVNVLSGTPILTGAHGIMSLDLATDALLVNAGTLNVAAESTMDGTMLVTGQYTAGGQPQGSGQVVLRGGKVRSAIWAVHEGSSILHLVDGTFDLGTLWTFGGDAYAPSMILHEGQHVLADAFMGDDGDVLRLEGGSLELGPSVSFGQPVFDVRRGSLRLSDAANRVVLSEALVDDGYSPRLGTNTSLWIAGEAEVGRDGLVLAGGSLSVAQLFGDIDFVRGVVEVREGTLEARQLDHATLREGDAVVAQRLEGALTVDGGSLTVGELADYGTQLQRGTVTVTGSWLDLGQVLELDDVYDAYSLEQGQVIDVQGRADAGSHSLYLRGGVLRAAEVTAGQFGPRLESGELHILSDLDLSDLELLPHYNRLVGGQTLRVDGELRGVPDFYDGLIVDGGTLHAGTLATEVFLQSGELSVGGDLDGMHTLGANTTLRVGGTFTGFAELDGGMLEVGSLDGQRQVAFDSGKLIVHDDLNLLEAIEFADGPYIDGADGIEVDGQLSVQSDLTLRGGLVRAGMLGGDGRLRFHSGELAITSGDLDAERFAWDGLNSGSLLAGSSIRVSGRLGEGGFTLAGGLLDVGQLAQDNLNVIEFASGELRVRDQDVRLTNPQRLDSEQTLRIDRQLTLESSLTLDGGTLAVGSIAEGSNLHFYSGTLHWLGDFFDHPATADDELHRRLRELGPGQRLIVDGNLFALAGERWAVHGGSLTAQRVIGAPLDFRAGRVELTAPGVVLGDPAGALAIDTLRSDMTLQLHQALRVDEAGFALQGGHLIVDALTPEALERLEFNAGHLEVTSDFDSTGYGLLTNNMQTWTFGGHLRLSGQNTGPEWRAQLIAEDLTITPSSQQLAFVEPAADVHVEGTLDVSAGAAVRFQYGAALTADVLDVHGYVGGLSPESVLNVRELNVRRGDGYYGRVWLAGATLNASEKVTVASPWDTGSYAPVRLIGPAAKLASPLIENDGWVQIEGGTIEGQLVNRARLTSTSGTFVGTLINELDADVALSKLMLDGSLINHGDAAGDITLLAGASVINHGQMTGSIDASLGAITNHGTLGDSGNEVIVAGPLTNYGNVYNAVVTGSVSNMADGVAEGLQLEGAMSNAGTVRGYVQIKGNVDNQGAFEVDITDIDGDMVNDGTISGYDRTLNISGVLTNRGQIDANVNAGSVINEARDWRASMLSITANVTNRGGLSVFEPVRIAGDLHNATERAGTTAPPLIRGGSTRADLIVEGSLINDGYLYMVLPQTRLTVRSDLVNSGRFQMNGDPVGGTTWETFLLVEGNLSNGPFQSSGGRTYGLLYAMTVSVEGDLHNEGIASVGQRLEVTGDVDNRRILNSSTYATIGANLTNSGSVSGSAITVTQNVSNSGTITTTEGLIVGGDLSNAVDGVINGDVAVTGSIFNDGVISPGNSPGSLSVGGDLILGPTGRLVLEIAGANGEQDVIDVGGKLVLGGVVEIAFIDGFAPEQGQSFVLFSPETIIEGEPEKIVVTGLLPGFEYEIERTGGAGGFVLEALSDGVVPEPATVTLLLGATGLLAGASRRTRCQAA